MNTGFPFLLLLLLLLLVWLISKHYLRGGQKWRPFVAASICLYSVVTFTFHLDIHGRLLPTSIPAVQPILGAAPVN